MNTALIRTASGAVSLVAALALTGCGGGGGGSTSMAPADAAPTVRSGGGGGGGPRPAAPVTTIAESLASSDNQFTPLTVATRAMSATDPESVALTDDFRVTSISSDGANGWQVTIVRGGVETMIHFEHGAFSDRTGGDPGSFYSETDGDDEFWFWSEHSRNLDEGREQRFRYFDHVDANVRVGSERDRYMLVYGNRTGPAGLPAGTALYTGWLYSRTQSMDNRDQSGRLDIGGPMRLVADFASGTVEGGITGIQFRRYDENGDPGDWEAIPTTNRFVFEHGRLTGAQFMAELTGMDSGSNALEDTVRGFEGTVHGEFYGPEAEEMGAVVSAESAAHNRTLIGRLHSKQLDPRTFGGERIPLSVGIERDVPTMQVRMTDTATTTVTAIEGDGAGGFHVTYQVDGAPQRVHLEASDYGSDPEFPYIFASDGDNSPYILFDMSGSFSQTPDFDHFNAQGWLVIAYDANGDDENTRRGLMVYGNRTEVADLPAGTASYEGRMFAFGNPSDDPDPAVQDYIRGSLALTADFANSDVTGRMYSFEVREGLGGNYGAVAGELAISNGAISGNEFTADLAGSVEPGSFDGDMSGQFFGPAAAEVGGIMSGEYTETGETAVLHGFFGGKQQ